MLAHTNTQTHIHTRKHTLTHLLISNEIQSIVNVKVSEDRNFISSDCQPPCIIDKSHADKCQIYTISCNFPTDRDRGQGAEHSRFVLGCRTYKIFIDYISFIIISGRYSMYNSEFYT